MEHQASRHETTDAPTFPVAAAGIGLALVAALVFFITYAMFHFLKANPPAAVENPLGASEQIFPPAPRLEVDAAIEMKDMLSQEHRHLSTYGWVDRKAGTIRIPIDRAIDLQLQRGFPVRKEAPKR